jgi:arylsulfatase
MATGGIYAGVGHAVLTMIMDGRSYREPTMDAMDERSGGVTRREFLAGVATGVAAATLLGPHIVSPAQAQQTTARATSSTSRYNILFVFTDQERYFRSWPSGLSLPGHERLQRTGITFHNHYCPAVMCTSSRAVLMTGLQTADNRMFENADAPWVQALSTRVPTIGHILRKAGYYTAYKGKWHLNKEFESSNPDRLFTSEMETYGFDYAWPGDLLAHEQGGYRFDHMIAGSTVSWLRNKGRPLADQGKPWSLCESRQPARHHVFKHRCAGTKRTGHGADDARGAPDHPDYRRMGHCAAEESRAAFDEAGRPQAHSEYDKAWSYALGRIPLEEARWRFSDYYINCIRAVDAQLATMLFELDASG